MKIINFLDITLDLTDGSTAPHNKENNIPVYVHAQSNHPPHILKHLPLQVNQRLNILSSNEEKFNAAAPLYQKALDDAGYKHTLRYEQQDIQKLNKKKKTRCKPQYHFCPPYSANVATAVGQKFIKIVESEFPKGSPLYKIFNKHTLKLGSSCMPNMARQISAHNTKVAKDYQQQQQQNQQPQPQPVQPAEKPCTCPKNKPCPLDGKCNIEKNIIYTCKVTRLDTNQVETYTGLTADTFKTRLYGHNSSFKHRDKSNTGLSNYIWFLKDNNIQYRMEWRVLCKAKSFNPVTRVCRLCLMEKFYIMYNPADATLNIRDEFYQRCMHKWRYLLMKAKG